MNVQYGTLEPAEASDRDSVEKLLCALKLPFEDVGLHLPHFFVAKKDDVLIGCVGLEVYGDLALLRSLAVVTSLQGHGIGKALYEEAIRYARQQGVRRLFLLTTDKAFFFERFGFYRLDRNKAPQEIRSTMQFTALCPSTAVLMAKELEPQS